MNTPVKLPALHTRTFTPAPYLLKSTMPHPANPSQLHRAFGTHPGQSAILLAATVLALGATPAWAQASKDSKNAEAPKTAAPRAALTITTVKPSQSTLPLRLAANGNIAAWQEASVGAEVAGLRLAEVLVDVGDTVRREQVLAVFASDTVQADLAQARAAVAEASAQAADASANAERARSLQDSGALSQQQISQLLTAELAARARLESARAVLQQQELRLKKTQLLAPDAGVISSRTATVGAVVGAGTELFRLIRQGRLEWRAEVTAAELGRVKPGTRVHVVTASGAKVDGRVRLVGPTVDPQTRAALVYVDLGSAAGSSARAGMFARGEFELGSSGALTVPQQSVVVRDGFNYVFAVDAAKKVAQTKVEVGRRVGEQVEILQGLKADTTIAATGAGFLNDGDTVRVNNEAAK